MARRERVVKKVPARVQVKAPAVRSGGKLKALQKQIVELRVENARLQDALAQYIEQWETLDGPQVSTLQYLAGNAEGHAVQIARVTGINIQIAETSLVFLRQCGYVVPADTSRKNALGAKAKFLLSPKGTRYLRSRGLHK